MEARRRLEQIAGLGVHKRAVTMIGGAAQSRIWPQIVCDVLDVPVEVPENKEAAAVGAALLGLKAADLIADLHEGCRMVERKARRFSPDPADRAVYDRLFCKYKTITED